MRGFQDPKFPIRVRRDRYRDIGVSDVQYVQLRREDMIELNEDVRNVLRRERAMSVRKRENAAVLKAMAEARLAIEHANVTQQNQRDHLSSLKRRDFR